MRAPHPDLQIAFARRLAELRETMLLDALLAVVAKSDIAVIDEELRRIAPPQDLQRLASAGLRGELLFAVPAIIEASPRLLGYYRLLLGYSQKELYGGRHGLGRFKALEDRGEVPPSLLPLVEPLCQALAAASSALLAELPEPTRSVAHDLTLLTLGAQLRGSALNTIGSVATRQVFDAIRAIVTLAIHQEKKDRLELINAAGRTVHVAFAPDPDICIQEVLPSGATRDLVAIEIKGGRDVSNIHNRIGEAEKSHQKAKGRGFAECWTLVGVADLDLALAKQESPTTDRFFEIALVTDAGTKEHAEFAEALRSRVGIRDSH